MSTERRWNGTDRGQQHDMCHFQGHDKGNRLCMWMCPCLSFFVALVRNVLVKIDFWLLDLKQAQKHKQVTMYGDSHCRPILTNTLMY